VRLLPSAERVALLQYLWRLHFLHCADTNSTLIVLALNCLLERNIHSLPQPAGPVKVANGGDLSGTKKQVAGYDRNSWPRLWVELGNRRFGLPSPPIRS